jgi:tetratricopeptide (TPR) repeat protein
MEDPAQTGDPHSSGKNSSIHASTDRALGAAIAECQQRLPTRNPRALRAALQDLLGSETLLSQPLRHLIDLPGFHQLNNEKSAFVRETQSTALLQELAQFYQPYIINRITLVLHGYLGLTKPVNTTTRQEIPEGIDGSRANPSPMAENSYNNQRETAGHFLEKALAALRQDAYHQAIHWLSKGLAEEPNHAEAYLQRGKAYLKLNDHGSAMNDFNNAARLLPNDGEIYVQRGSLHQLMGAHTQARMDWEKSCELGNQEAVRLLKEQQTSRRVNNPKASNTTTTNQPQTASRPQDLFKRSTEALRQANYEEADNLLTMLLALDPGHAAAYLERGKTRSALSRDGSAMNDFDASIRLAPNIAEGYAHRGILHAKRGDNQKAKNDLLIALRLGHPQAGAWLTQQQQMLTQSHLKCGIEATNRRDYKRALSSFHSAIQINDKNSTTYLQAGLSISQLGHHQEAIAWLSQSISLNPSSSLAHLARGKARLAINKQDKAIEDFTRAISINPDCADAYFNRALAHKALHHTDSARSDLLKASSLGATEAAEILAQMPQPQQAAANSEPTANDSTTKIEASARALNAVVIIAGFLASLWIGWEGFTNQNWRPLGAAIGCGFASTAIQIRKRKK